MTEMAETHVLVQQIAQMAASVLETPWSAAAVTCVCSAQGWLQLQCQGLWKPSQRHAALVHALDTGSCSVCLCLHWHRRILWGGHGWARVRQK